MDKEIRELLYLHDCVILPGLGGLVANVKAANIELYRKEIHAPSKSLAFNELLQQNDGVLINFVAKQHRVDYKSAEKLVLNFVNTCRNSIERNGSFYLSGIGKLYRKDDAKQIHFLPSTLNNFNVDNFGLGNLKLEPIKRIVHEEVVVEATSVMALPPKKKHYSKVPFFSAAAMATLFLLTTLLLNIFTKENISAENRSSISNIPAKQETVQAKQLVQSNSIYKKLSGHNVVFYTAESNIEIETEIANKLGKVDPSETTVKTLINVKPSIAHLEGDFTIIIGSFRDEGNVQKLVTKVEGKGYNSTTIEGPHGFKRVGITFAKNTHRQDETLERVRDQFTINAWLID